MPLKMICDECGQRFPPPEGWRFSFCPGCRQRFAARQSRRPKPYVDTKDFLQSDQWLTLRRVVGERAHWKCARHLAHGIVVAGESFVVDHIAPRRVRPDLATVEANLQVMCSRCHNSKSRNEQHGLVIDWEVDRNKPVVLGGAIVGQRLLATIEQRTKIVMPSSVRDSIALSVGSVVIFESPTTAFAYARANNCNVFTVMN